MSAVGLSAAWLDPVWLNPVWLNPGLRPFLPDLPGFETMDG